MTFNLQEEISRRAGQARALHDEFVNPVLANVLELIGFQHEYSGGEGCYLTARNGKRYFDGLSGYGVFGMGRNHPVVCDAIKQALDAGFPNLVQMDTFLLSGMLAEKLISIAPGTLQHVFFTNSGTEAVEGAIKFARAATGRQGILHQPSAFHGLSTGSLALNGDESFRESFGSLLPGCKKISFEDLAVLEAELKTESYAAVILEPIRGKGVFLPKDDSLYPAIQDLCRKYGTLLIVDEIQTGLGRTGKWWACQHWNLEPDILTCAKALSGGLVPVGAILSKRDVYLKVYNRLDRCVVHSSTFGQNALAMVAGLASLHVIESENLVERAAQRGAQLLNGLRTLQEKSEFIKDVRGKGLIIGVEFGSPKSMLLKPAWSLLHAAENGLFAQAVVMQLYQEHQLLTQVSGHHQEIVKLLPPLILSEQEVEMIVHSFDAVLQQCAKFPGPVWSVGKQLASAAAKQQIAKHMKKPA